MLGIIRGLAYKVEDYVTTTSALSLLIQLASVGASIVGIVLAILRIPYATYAVLTVLLILSVFLLLINARLFDEKRQASDFIQRIIHAQRQQYTYRTVSHDIRVEESGDGWFSTSYSVVPLDSSALYWIKVTLGVTNAVPGIPFSGLKFGAHNKNGVELEYFLIGDEPRGKELIIFFDRPATAQEPYSFGFTYNWPKGYKTLLLKGKDHGLTTFQSEIEAYHYTIEVPPRIKIQGFSITPALPDPPCHLNVTSNKVEWTISGSVPKNDYRYDVICIRA
ncbi:MAG TPA: hypothetical protein VN937_11965 [Blastocatellia bacterium]|nr:hypothetical protein [Blastocatellia bacterium]